mgnify:FL=1
MSLVELFILAVGLSMDAFAVSICKGLSLGKISKKHMAIAGAWFGGFQALMPLIGYFLGSFFADMITKYAHWIAFVLLIIIGGNMIKEAMGEEEKVDACMDAKEMFILAIATSIDALAVGVTFAFLKVQIVPSVSFIGCVTFVCSAIGVKIGSIFGSKYRSKSEFCGGMILILIGLKILLNGLGII